jgi:hypothetical protein
VTKSCECGNEPSGLLEWFSETASCEDRPCCVELVPAADVISHLQIIKR